MKALTLCLLLLSATSCGDEVTNPSAWAARELAQNNNGIVEVYIYWQEQGIPDKQVEIVETGDSGTTGKDGLIAFELPPGTYTVRAFDINRGGPCCGYVDEKAEVKRNETTRIAIADCLICVAPGLISNQ